MTTLQIFVKNLQCGDCMKSIKNCLLKTKGVTGLEFIKEENRVCITGLGIEKELIIANLCALGYRDKENNGLFSKQNTFDFWYCSCCTLCDN